MILQAIRSKVARKIGDGINSYKLKGYREVVNAIKGFRHEDWTDEQLRNRSSELREEAKGGSALQGLLPEAFALVNEACSRVLGIQPFDVQMLAGIALFEGKLVEMRTGEGKTLAAVMPAYLHALAGKGVHVFTFNDYLAARDAEWMGPVYTFLGLSAGFVREGMEPEERREAYAKDVTYVTAKEACFDYLRDSLCDDVSSFVHRPFHVALVDEADSILIDEARVPLVIACERPGTSGEAARMAGIVNRLSSGPDYDADEYKRNMYLTERGAEKVESMLGCGNLYEAENASLLSAVHYALHAEALLKRDVDYLIRDGKVELIDEFTGRVAERRHWPDGLQAAVEAKEGLEHQAKGMILGMIPLQHYLSLYPKIAGMTATAVSSADEFKDTYGLDVVAIPPNRDCRRIDHPHLVFTHKAAKMNALIEEIAAVHKTERPILIGTASVEESDLLAARLEAAGVPCSVLNAKNDDREAEVIANAGKLGAVTVSTNMAGRGVDIRLGGDCPEQYAQVAALGGLYVIGTNLHESIRIDNQLRGRAGRQGDPGASRYYVSLEDDLIHRFGIEQAIPQEFRSLRQEEALYSPVILQRVEHVQRIVQGQNIEIRRTLNKYSDILEDQRRMVHEKRLGILLDDVENGILAEQDPDRFDYWLELTDEETLRKAEKEITLFHIDHCWADFLDYASYLREGIHLVSIGRKNPLDEFHRQIIEAFETFDQRVGEEVVRTFRTIAWRGGQFDFQLSGIRKPSATWTYIVNDNFFQNRVSIV
ncbi:accessory Sec system translocase SecA2 [Paenibacillus sp. MBLB4367]|uniref:accessory Sec system translocase SecA2 n=1 Tax=Paenibacillus sp. MBLB4367 TaxID=3384767 RepID=UPI00390805CB